jgi:beta-aspartyl-peptidase (threonine type)
MNLFRKTVMCCAFFTACCSLVAQNRDYVIVVHGGAGNMTALKGDTVAAAKYYAALDTALSIGDKVLSEGGEGAEAVMAVIGYFESNPMFNAGIGATVTADGNFELDAALMDGSDLSAGAVAGVKHVKHPIQAAYAVKTKSPHVMLSGDGADQFARSVGLEMVDDNMYFATPKSLKWIEEIKKSKNGTVGCVVLDRKGNLTAGTSTGGMFKKQWGRIGDSPVIGAGTYADNQSCAVSCTGHGEYFIRHAVAFNVCARYKYLKESVADAADYIIHKELNPEAGNGGLIAVDKQGNIAMPYNSNGMFRGYLYKEKGSDRKVKKVGIFEQMR